MPDDERIRARSLREQIVEVVREAIIGGDYRPGQRLVERELVSRFGVSSIPVREALHELERLGLVERRHNRGCSVIDLGPDQQKKMSAVRRVLEPAVVEWAAARAASERHRQPLLGRLEALEAAARAGDHAGFFRTDFALHRDLWAMSGNEYAARALEPVVGSLFAVGLARARASKVDLMKEADRHAAVVHAVLRRDARSAARALLLIAQGYEAILAGPRAR
jgi:DNA-binding GntR family transcriptional regulator